MLSSRPRPLLPAPAGAVAPSLLRYACRIRGAADPRRPPSALDDAPAGDLAAAA